MFKKIHSNRNPKNTLLNEIRNEFSPYFNKAGRGLSGFAKSYPRFLFWMMVINISLSAILCFTVFRRKAPPPIKVVAPKFDNIIEMGGAIRKTIKLKHEVDSISKKKTLNSTDSAVLFKDLDSLNHIKINP